MLSNDNKIASLLPLTPVVFHILLAVSQRQLHGYAIMQEVNRRSEDRVGLGPGTLYGAIQRMEDAGLLQKASAPKGEKQETRRRYYSMTVLGRAALHAEADRLEALVAYVRGEEIGSDSQAQ